MKRTDLLRSLRRIAKAKGYRLVEWRDKGDHTIYRFDGHPQNLPVPRHREINELTANGVIDTAENIPPNS